MKDFYAHGKKRKWQAKDETIKIKYASNYIKNKTKNNWNNINRNRCQNNPKMQRWYEVKAVHVFKRNLNMIFHETAISFLMVRHIFCVSKDEPIKEMLIRLKLHKNYIYIKKFYLSGRRKSNHVEWSFKRVIEVGIDTNVNLVCLCLLTGDE